MLRKIFFSVLSACTQVWGKVILLFKYVPFFEFVMWIEKLKGGCKLGGAKKLVFFIDRKSVV